MNDDEMVSFPPRHSPMVLGLFRPAQVLSLLASLMVAGTVAAWCRPVAAIPLIMVFLSLGLWCSFGEIGGEPIERYVGSALWLAASRFRLDRLANKPLPDVPLLVVAIHNDDLYLESPSMQWLKIAGVGEALATAASSLASAVQVLTVDRRLLSANLAEQVIGDHSAQAHLTLLIAQGGAHAEATLAVTAQALQSLGAHVGPLVPTTSQIVDLGRIRQISRQSCRTTVGCFNTAVLDAPPVLPVGPGALIDLVVQPTWAMHAVTISAPLHGTIQRRLERRQTAAMADSDLLDRRGFRRSAAREATRTKADDFEAALASGARAVHVHVHLACFANDPVALDESLRAVALSAKRCAVALRPLSGRHHLALDLFGRPHVLVP